MACPFQFSLYPISDLVHSAAVCLVGKILYCIQKFIESVLTVFFNIIMEKKGCNVVTQPPSLFFPLTLGAKKMCFQVAALFLLLIAIMSLRQRQLSTVTVVDSSASAAAAGAGQEVMVSERERREAMPSVSSQQAHWRQSGTLLGAYNSEGFSRPEGGKMAALKALSHRGEFAFVKLADFVDGF